MGSLRLIDNAAIWTAGIPNGWQLVQLKHVVTKLNRVPNEGDSVLICTNKGTVIPRDQGNPGLISLTNAGYQGVEPGDLLIHGMDTWHGAIAVSSIRGQCTSVVHVCDSSQDKRFIAYYLRALAFRGVYKAFSNGVRQNTSDFRSWVKAGEIPLILPTIEEQRHIADYLDAMCAEIDGAIKSAESSISDYKAYRNALVYQTVMHGMSSHSQSVKESGVSYIGTIPQNWSCVPIKLRFEIVKRIAGGGGFKVLSITQKGLKPKDFSTGKGQFARSYDNYQIVEPGDFAMNHMDLVTGWVDLSSQLGVTSPDYRVFKARDDSMEKRYYLYVFQSYYSALVFYGFGKGISGKGRWRLPAPAFYSTMIPVPPLNEQHVIADCLDAKCSIIDEAITSKQSIIDDLKAYKQSLIYEVVTGKKEV